MATMKDVARVAGVSFTTVSHVVNGTRVVAPETRARVEAAIKELGYTPNVVARGLRKGETKTVGVIGTTSDDPYFSEVLHGVQERGWVDGYSVFISYSDYSDACCTVDEASCTWEDQCEREIDYIAEFGQRSIQGLILNSLLPDAELAETLGRATIPCILFQRFVTGPGWDNFVCDDFQGASDAMAHLLSLGHRRIALVEGFGFDTHSVKYRKKAWKASLEAAGLSADERYVRDGRYSPDVAYEATKDLLSLPDRPTAILFYSDTMALAGIRAAFDLGLSVPRDVSIIGYDSLKGDRFSVPRLTSVNQQSVRIGQEMMERLMERIANPGLEAIVRSYPQNLEIRESTAGAPGEI